MPCDISFDTHDIFPDSLAAIFQLSIDGAFFYIQNFCIGYCRKARAYCKQRTYPYSTLSLPLHRLIHFYNPIPLGLRPGAFLLADQLHLFVEVHTYNLIL